MAIPSTPSAGNSPASDESSNLPRTPVSPSNMPLANPTSPDQPHNPQVNHQNPGSVQMKRKPSRRANTAERRATHNAVERQRRETLNGRFLDLAALLPNLSQIRRPSKSSIVNSSIAHFHASRRHRQLASRELRLLKLEADAIRREVNDWRDRACVPRLEEPVRSEGFTMVLTGEIEVLAAVIDEEDGGDGYDGYEDGDEFNNAAPSMMADDSDDLRMNQVRMPKNVNANAFSHNLPPSSAAASNVNSGNGMHLTHIMPRASQHGGPMIASNPSSVSFENPAMASLYEPNQAPFSAQYVQSMGQHDAGDKWNAQLFNTTTLGGSQLQQQQQQQLQAQRGLFTPPASALSSSTAPSSASTNTSFNDQEFFASFQRQQQMAAMHQQNIGHMYGSPADGDDSSSVGSGSGGRRRERSGSLNSGGSGYASPQHGSPMGNYELSSTAGAEAQSSSSDYGMTKRFNAGLHINTSVVGHWGGGRGADSVDGMNGMMKHNLNPPISVGGGGGNGNGFASMMMM
jgi:hypothetical protein